VKKIMILLNYKVIMPKISGHGHVLTWTDGVFSDGRVYLQKRETVKEYTGGGPMGKPLMLKSDACDLKDIYSESIEVRKECVPCLRSFFALYRRL
jgi:hypothetical protein